MSEVEEEAEPDNMDMEPGGCEPPPLEDALTTEAECLAVELDEADA